MTKHGWATQNTVEFFVKVFKPFQFYGFFNFGTIPNCVYQKSLTYAKILDFFPDVTLQNVPKTRKNFRRSFSPKMTFENFSSLWIFSPRFADSGQD